MAWPVFLGSGPGPEGPSRNDSGVFPQPARLGLMKPDTGIVVEAGSRTLSGVGRMTGLWMAMVMRQS
jgi:hypothetical protein